MTEILQTPFPWFGGKSKAAELIWSRIGTDCGNYVEPFFGSGAIWLNRPNDYAGWSVVNDIDGHVCNVWRSMRSDPVAVAEYACNPVNECDLHARHVWLNARIKSLSSRLMADPDYCDPRAAGYWIWGTCCWIGNGWCSGKGPWTTVLDDEGVPVFTKTGNGSQRKGMPYLSRAGMGVNRQIPHITSAGMGVNRKIPHISNAGNGARLKWLQDWFSRLSDRLSETRITCGDWTRIMTVSTMMSNGTCAVVLDPPYSNTDPVYAHDSSTVGHDVHAWCVENGSNTKLRIALCGHDGDHNELEQLGWKVETWAKCGGYQGKDDRERIWFSPGCLKQQELTCDLTLNMD